MMGRRDRGRGNFKKGGSRGGKTRQKERERMIQRAARGRGRNRERDSKSESAEKGRANEKALKVRAKS